MQRLAAFFRAIWIWLLLLALAAGGVVGYRYYQQRQAEQARLAALAAIRSEVVQRGDIEAVVSATGRVVPAQQSSLFFQAAGMIEAVLVENGDSVRAGQLLAQLDHTAQDLGLSQALDAVAVAELNRDKLLAGPLAEDISVARANLRAANANVADLASGAGSEEVSIAQLRYGNLQADYQNLADQYNNLLQFSQDHPQFAPGQDVIDSLKANMENAYYTAEIARVQLEAAQSGPGPGPLSVGYAQIAQAQAVLSQTMGMATPLQVEQADLAVEQAQTSVEQTRLNLAQAQLVAPFAGVVANVTVRAGEQAAPGVPVLTLLDTTTFYLELNVDEVDVAQLAVGQAVSVTVDALAGQDLSGRVERLAPAATVIGGLVNYTVRLALDPTGAPLRAGMSATAQVVVAEARGVVLVPNWAIRRDRRTGQAYASVQRGDGLEDVAIVTGLRGESYTEVVGGVLAGDVAAVSTAREGLDLFGGP